MLGIDDDMMQAMYSPFSTAQQKNRYSKQNNTEKTHAQRLGYAETILLVRRMLLHLLINFPTNVNSVFTNEVGKSVGVLQFQPHPRLGNFYTFEIYISKLQDLLSQLHKQADLIKTSLESYCH